MQSKAVKEGTLEVSGKGPVRLRLIAVDKTTSAVEIGVDYALAPLPHLHYDADFCDVKESRTGIVLIFGKLRAGTNHLRTKIEIAFSSEYFAKQVWGTSRALHETVRKLSTGKELVNIEEPEDIEKVQCFRANNVFMAVLSSEAVLDFYYLSPGEVHLAQNKNKSDVVLESVVRVVVGTPLLFEFLEKCRPLGERLTEIIEKEEGDR
jgi:hypothetical protein